MIILIFYTSLPIQVVQKKDPGLVPYDLEFNNIF